jgi:hypothetical protein
MGKWAARLADETAAPCDDVTDKTAKRGLVSVLSVARGAVLSEFVATVSAARRPAVTHESHDLAAVSRGDADLAHFLDRRARLMRWGWTEADAEKLADRLGRRDRDDGDDRTSCTDCRHFRPRHCGNHTRAGLNGAEIGRDLASQLQRCGGFMERGE